MHDVIGFDRESSPINDLFFRNDILMTIRSFQRAKSWYYPATTRDRAVSTLDNEDGLK